MQENNGSGYESEYEITDFIEPASDFETLSEIEEVCFHKGVSDGFIPNPIETEYDDEYEDQKSEKIKRGFNNNNSNNDNDGNGVVAVREQTDGCGMESVKLNDLTPKMRREFDFLTRFMNEEDSTEDEMFCPIEVVRNIGIYESFHIYIAYANNPYVLVHEDSPAVSFLLQKCILKRKNEQRLNDDDDDDDDDDDESEDEKEPVKKLSWDELCWEYLRDRWVPMSFWKRYRHQIGISDEEDDDDDDDDEGRNINEIDIEQGGYDVEQNSSDSDGDDYYYEREPFSDLLTPEDGLRVDFLAVYKKRRYRWAAAKMKELQDEIVSLVDDNKDRRLQQQQQQQQAAVEKEEEEEGSSEQGSSIGVTKNLTLETDTASESEDDDDDDDDWLVDQWSESDQDFYYYFYPRMKAERLLSKVLRRKRDKEIDRICEEKSRIDDDNVDDIGGPYADLEIEYGGTSTIPGKARELTGSWGISIAKGIKSIMSQVGLPVSKYEDDNKPNSEDLPLLQPKEAPPMDPLQEPLKPEAEKQKNKTEEKEEAEELTTTTTSTTTAVDSNDATDAVFRLSPTYQKLLNTGSWYRMTIDEYDDWTVVASMILNESTIFRGLEKCGSTDKLHGLFRDGFENSNQAKRFVGTLRRHSEPIQALADAQQSMFLTLHQMFENPDKDQNKNNGFGQFYNRLHYCYLKYREAFSDCFESSKTTYRNKPKQTNKEKEKK